jgi:DNA translocase ftsK
MVKRKTESKPKRKSSTFSLSGIFKISNERTDFVLGVVLILLAVYVGLAMFSFFTTGKADQSILEDLRPGEWLNTGKEFSNYCGSLGAILAYTLITLNFGFAAFAIPIFILLAGAKLTRAYKVNLWKTFFYLAIIMIWCSVAFAKFLTPLTGSLTFNPGGNHGLYCVQNIENMIGPPGLTALLFIVALAFLTYLSAETVSFVRKAINPVKYITSKVKFTIANNGSRTVPADKDEEVEVETQQENGQANDDGGLKDEENELPTVVDLTDGTMGLGGDKPFGGAHSHKEQQANGDPSAQLKVEIPQGEETASGRELTAAEVLSTPINPLEPFLSYKYPTLNLLKAYDNDSKPYVDMTELKANNDRIIKVLRDFGVEIREIKATVGPTITLYEITPAEGVRINKIRNLEDDIALSLAALGIRIIAPIPGKGTIGIEVPNNKPNIVSMESILNSKKFQETKMDLPLALGKTITNEVFMVDLAKIPHLLVAGATGQGKSVGLNAVITSLLYKKHPNELKLVLIDPKKVEFSIYSPIVNHFLAKVPEEDDEPIITDVTKVVRTLNSLCKLMDTRYDMLKMAGARNIKEYNDKFVNHQLNLTKGHEYMPYIVVIIDEFGDLIMTAGKEIELPIARIAQLARAVGIHMVIATQRPTTSIITGNIKANFPGRMAFKVSAMIDSRTILDRPGANQLIGRGDMLFLNGNEPVRVQCAFVDTPEVERINRFIADQPGPIEPMELPEPNTEEGGIGGGTADMNSLDPYFEEAARAIVISQQGSTSMVQRRFSIGYNRAGRLMDQLEVAGVVGIAQGSKPREVLITDENTLNALLAKLRGAG